MSSTISGHHATDTSRRCMLCSARQMSQAASRRTVQLHKQCTSFARPAPGTGLTHTTCKTQRRQWRRSSRLGSLRTRDPCSLSARRARTCPFGTTALASTAFVLPPPGTSLHRTSRTSCCTAFWERGAPSEFRCKARIGWPLASSGGSC